MAPVTVNVRLSGPLAERLGARRAVGMAEGDTVHDLCETLAEEAGVERIHADALAVVAGGTFLDSSRTLADGDELEVLVPVAGG
jgi:molybdopterin converting factor small subunit